MKNLEPGQKLHILIYVVNESEGLYAEAGEIVVEENPESADRYPEEVSSFLVYFDDLNKRTESRIIGFHRARGAMDLLVEALGSLGLLKP